MTQKIRVGVIFGGRSGEHEVSLVSATSVMSALDREKYDVVPVGITPEGRWISSAQALGMLKEKAPLDREPERFLIPEPNRQGLVSADGNGTLPVPLDVVFPLVHGTYGEDGTLQGLLELANIPYVGAGVLASSVGMDKIIQKMIFREAGLPLVRYTWCYSAVCRENPRKVARMVEKDLRYPVFVKPANTGSSVGISKVHSRGELAPALLLAAEFDRKVIIEQGVPRAREIECSVLGNDVPEASVPGEVIPSNEFYDYNAKYVDGKSASVIPARIPGRRRPDGAAACAPRLHGHRLRGDGARGFLRHEREAEGVSQRSQHDPRVHGDKHVSENVGGVRSFVPRAPRPAYRACHGASPPR